MALFGLEVLWCFPAVIQLGLFPRGGATTSCGSDPSVALPFTLEVPVWVSAVVRSLKSGGAVVFPGSDPA